MTVGRFSVPTRARFVAVARGLAFLGALAGSLVAVSTARAADAETTGALGTKPGEAEWWRLRPAQGPMIEVPKGVGAPLPEARKAVRIVYPTPYEAR